jgi:hypothetical protein
LEKQRSSISKQSKLAPRSQIAKRFEALHRDQTLDEVYTAVGIPSRVSGVSVPRGAVGHMYVKVNTSEDMIELTYNGIGVVRFAYNDSLSNWLLDVAESVTGLYWSTREGRFASMHELINSTDERDLQEVAKYLLQQNNIEKGLLNRVADRIYRSRMDPNEELADSLAWLTKVIAMSRDGRYRKLLLDVSNTAVSSKLQRYAAKAASELPETSDGDYLPSSAEKTTGAPATGQGSHTRAAGTAR